MPAELMFYYNVPFCSYFSFFRMTPCTDFMFEPSLSSELLILLIDFTVPR